MSKLPMSFVTQRGQTNQASPTDPKKSIKKSREKEEKKHAKHFIIKEKQKYIADLIGGKDLRFGFYHNAAPGKDWAIA